jgi:hypothetical protein
MLFYSALATILALPALISGDQIPAVDGVIGGVPSGAHNSKNLARAVSRDASTQPTPGKLRVVENSGVCGRVISFLIMHPLSYSHFWQKLHLVSIRLPDMVIYLRIRAYGLCSILSVPSAFIFICDPPNRFWFFAARNNPDTAPLITWFNGGVSDTVRHSILQYSGSISAWKF